ncbi:MBL fold metallo-hydrolase [bacterium]|nr:MBL fold metallo-hydrolase [bacterium]
MPERLAEMIDWFGHASFRFRGSKTVYVDPWKIDKESHDADIILITHEHYDHYSPDDIKKVAGDTTIVVFPESMRDKVDFINAVFLARGERQTVDGVDVEVVAAFNTNKDYHPDSKDWVGYIVNLDGIRIYHSGDTDNIDEMNSISCDVALLPVSGTYVMTAVEAIEAARRIGPRLAIPMHWGDIVGGREDAEEFARGAPCPVVIKEHST